MDEVEIGYLCYHGHYCFYADPDEGGQCGSKSIGKVVVRIDPDLTGDRPAEVLSEASDSLGRVYETWRGCECQ